MRKSMMVITDEMVERAAQAIAEKAYPNIAPPESWARVALEAALREVDDTLEISAHLFGLTVVYDGQRLDPRKTQMIYARAPLLEIAEKYRAALQRIAAEESGVWGTIARDALKEDFKREGQ